ncbi:hypothetical protein [Pseudoneobacillus sp. C159]
MNDNEIYSNIKQVVQEAEEAVIKAQGNSEPQFLQQAGQQLMHASEYIDHIENQVDSVNGVLAEDIHRAKEHLRNLQENQNALK